MKSIARLTDRPGYRVIRSLARKLRQIRSRVEAEVPASLIASRGESMQIAGDGHWKRSIASKRLQFTQSLVLMLLPALLTGLRRWFNGAWISCCDFVNKQRVLP